MTSRPRFDGVAGTGDQRIGGLRAADTTVDTPHGPALIAVDDDGLRHLLVPAARDLEAAPDRGVSVTIELRTLMDRGADRRFVDVACLEPRLDDLFDTVVDEILDRLQEHPDRNPFRNCQYVLDRWRQLLRRGGDRLLQRDRLAGLLAELLWLEQLTGIAADAALAVWSGPSGAPQDFTAPGGLLEVKATTTDRVVINGIRQLHDPHGRPLWLGVVHLGPAGPDAVTVPGLVDRILDAGIDAAGFFDRLADAGYHTEHADQYAEAAWTVVGQSVWEVDSSFPRLTPDDTTFGSHAALTEVQYALLTESLPDPTGPAPEALASLLLR